MEEAGENARPGMPGGESREGARAGSGQGSSEGGQGREGASDMEDEVRRRAYELYQARGGEPGREFDDWYAAEQEVRGRRAAPDDRGGAGAAQRGPDAEPRGGMEGMGGANATEGMGEAPAAGGRRTATPRKRSAPTRRGRPEGGEG